MRDRLLPQFVVNPLVYQVFAVSCLLLTRTDYSLNLLVQPPYAPTEGLFL